jgi:hypothetical protein
MTQCPRLRILLYTNASGPIAQRQSRGLIIPWLLVRIQLGPVDSFDDWGWVVGFILAVVFEPLFTVCVSFLCRPAGI